MTMDLYVYDESLQLLGVVSRYRSLRWRRKYFEPGEVELHIPICSENLKLLVTGRYLIRKDADEGAVITGIELSGEDLSVSGRMMSQLLGRRVIYPRIQFSGTAESAMRQIVTANTAGDRALPLLTAANVQGFTPMVDFDTVGVNCVSALTVICKASGLGYRIRPDIPGKVLRFEVYQGVDRSLAQTENPHVTLSDEHLADPTYICDKSTWKNVAYVYTDTDVMTVDRSDGEGKRELWVNGNDINPSDYTTQDAYQAALQQRGDDRLAELPILESFESSLQSADLGYKEDWDLGDILTVRMTRWDKTAFARVSEVEEIYEGGTTEIIPVLGSPLPEKLVLGDGF